MRVGIRVRNIFAALWGVAAVLVGQLPTWLALVAIALLTALLVHPPLNRAVISGVAAALVLWISGIMLVRYGRGELGRAL